MALMGRYHQHQLLERVVASFAARLERPYLTLRSASYKVFVICLNLTQKLVCEEAALMLCK